jgi:Zn-dependent protease
VIKLLFLLLSAAKLGKLTVTGGTMLLSLFAYALIYGWRYAAGFVLLILVHEMGHYVAARQRGLEVGAPTFIPFVGAWVAMKQIPHDAETEAFVGIAGPVAGTAAAVACYYAARFWDAPLLLALAYAGCMINLFNLLPLSPLDGGRITAVLTPRLWVAGLAILVALFLWHPSPMLLLIGVLAFPQVLSVFRGGPGGVRESAVPGYYDVSQRTRIEYGLYYLGLAGFLAVMAWQIHAMLHP